ncbi:hypothetical protein E2C01_101154 [Portunus trituberculatus]|uniref:Uncharacterized protein n=1 Tax=Portunus trituberculatus TaxID=210409 RepID=A0A5B7KF48_PORTR|nr:hypothetical protein [Portunus trituberculatus]
MAEGLVSAPKPLKTRPRRSSKTLPTHPVYADGLLALTSRPRDVTSIMPLLSPLSKRTGSNPVHGSSVVTPKMRLGGDMDPNMGTTINNIACATNGRKLNSASHIFKYAYRRYRP